VAPRKPAAAEMRRAWERFAARDPMFYIDSSREDWDRDSFLVTGEATVTRWMEWLGDRVGRGAALEIGCGLGRTSVALAKRFDRVVGVDISSAMIDQARAFAPPTNVDYTVVPGDGTLPGLADETFDFVVSVAVFQHVPDEAVISTYLEEIHRVSRQGGVALLHFDTKPRSLVREIGYKLPDFMLARTRARFMRRYPRAADSIRALAGGAGFALDQERNPATANHYLTLRRPEPGA
jgi:SAM-dependent methyltransferase